MKLPLIFAAGVAATACAPPEVSTSAPLQSAQEHPPESAHGGAPEGSARRALDGNPFAGARFYVNPDYAAEVERAAAAATTSAPSDAARLRKLEVYPTAIWLDSIEKARTARRYLDDASGKQAAGGGPPVLVVFVLYDLPNRDCAAGSSAGELTLQEAGERRYRTEFVDRFAAELRDYPTLRVVAVVEPDSLANVATNLDRPRCGGAEAAYRRSIAYAIHTLSMPNVSLYLDAAHAGWLGRRENRANIARVYTEVISLAGGEGRLRGFATNVSNYNSLRGGEGAKLAPDNPCPDELTYVHELATSISSAGIRAHGFLVDTSRNGQPDIRTSWGRWCNVRGAGLGERPRASPEPGVDAYYWVKPPGESDGTSERTASRRDGDCNSTDSTPAAPEAGAMFPAYLAKLVARANPPL